MLGLMLEHHPHGLLEGQVVGRPILGGLHHEYERLAGRHRRLRLGVRESGSGSLRPHSNLGWLAPAAYAEHWEAQLHAGLS